MCHHWLLSWYQKHGGPAHYTLTQFTKVCRVVKAPWLVVWEILKSLCTDFTTDCRCLLFDTPSFRSYFFGMCEPAVPCQSRPAGMSSGSLIPSTLKLFLDVLPTATPSPLLPVSPLSSHFSPDFQVFLSCLTFTSHDFFCTTAFSHYSHCFSLFNTPLFFPGRFCPLCHPCVLNSLDIRVCAFFECNQHRPSRKRDTWLK